MLFYLISSIALGAIVAFLLLWKLSKKGDFNNELINKIIKIKAYKRCNILFDNWFNFRICRILFVNRFYN